MIEQKYDKNNNLIYCRYSTGIEYWSKYDKNNNEIYCRCPNGEEYWIEYNKNNKGIHYKDTTDHEYWYKYNNSGEQINIIEKEYNEIKFRAEEKEYNSRTKCSRFELIDI